MKLIHEKDPQKYRAIHIQTYIGPTYIDPYYNTYYNDYTTIIFAYLPSYLKDIQADYYYCS